MSIYNVTAYARQSQASPSISLEKGAYRMRAPPKRVKDSVRVRHDPRPSKDGFRTALHYEKQMAVLVVLLVCATVTCFGAAYYLFTTRWDAPARLHPGTTRSDVSEYSHPQVAVSFSSGFSGSAGLSDLGYEDDDLRLKLRDPGERFLAYLPHSGFHNQRIAFENALVLSRLLNRTLLVPPVRLGSAPLSYAPYDSLKELLVNTSKLEPQVQSCRQYVSRPDLAPSECVDYAQYTDVPWDWLVDLSSIKAEQRLLGRWNFTDDWLYDTLGIDDGDSDIFVVRDTGRDAYGFQDFISLTGTGKQGRKYRRMVHLSTLAHRPERVVLLGTLFGTARLHLRSPANLRLRADVRAQMGRVRPLVRDVAADVEGALGRGGYLGAHVRLGDGGFADAAGAHVRRAWWTVVHGMLGYGVEEAARVERALVGSPLTHEPPPGLPLDWESQTLGGTFSEFLPTRPSTLSCSGVLHTDPSLKLLNTPLYISTDSREPRSDPWLAPLLRTFPCTFFLSDFPAALGPLAPLHGALDGLPLRPFLEPLVDASVVARAVRVVGTDGSTFSRFVEDVLWRVHRGLDVVSRG